MKTLILNALVLFSPLVFAADEPINWALVDAYSSQMLVSTSKQDQAIVTELTTMSEADLRALPKQKNKYIQAFVYYTIREKQLARERQDRCVSSESEQRHCDAVDEVERELIEIHNDIR
jgi:hypothetical protein